MHLTRSETTKKIPIPRKGTKYIARPLSHLNNSVPVVIAVRDILKLAQNTKEVKKMIHGKMLKINGREVKNHNESIKLFNIFEAGKSYTLTLTPTKRFSFEEAKNANERICKIVNKTMFRGKKLQLNFHDGSSILAEQKVNVHDTAYLDFSGKIIKIVPFEKGKSCFIISGKYLGNKGKIETVNQKTAQVKFNETSAELPKRSVIAL